MKALFFVFFSAVIIRVIFGDSIELSATVDGAGRYDSLVLYSGTRVSAGTTVKFDPESPVEVIGGLNMTGFSVGHLGDSGLASEVRNPGYDSLSRLAERTFYMADLRSDSLSRYGIALMAWEERVGVVWERREAIDAGIIWTVPVSLEEWSFEILGEAGLLRSSESDESWYTQVPWRPAGPFAVAAGRLRYITKKTRLGSTFMFSGGSSLQPGWLTSAAMNYFAGPLQFRSRFSYSTPTFRNADGERLVVPIGGSFDFRYRPSKGIQIYIEYQGGYGSEYVDEGGAALGWRFGELQVSIESYWNHFFSTIDSSLQDCRRLKSRVLWDRGLLHAGITGTWAPKEGWSLKVENIFPIHDSWLIESFLVCHREKGPLLFDFKIKTYWIVGKNSFVFSIFTGDLLRDWDDGPSSSGDFEAQLRWIRKFGK